MRNRVCKWVTGAGVIKDSVNVLLEPLLYLTLSLSNFHNMAAIDSDAHRVEAKAQLDWVTEVQSALRRYQNYMDEEVLVFKLPDYLRSPPEDFTPKEWRFGLHNRGALHVDGSEAMKISAAAAFGLVGSAWDDFCDEIVDDCGRVLKSYGLHDQLTTNFNEREVKYLLALDALFLVLRFGSVSQVTPALESLLQSPYAIPRLQALALGDIVLLENQIPMELLRKVVKKCTSNNCLQSASSTHTNDYTAEEIEALDKILKEAMECASPFPDQLIIDGNDYTIREYLNLTYNPGTLGSCRHILDCVHNMICGPKDVARVPTHPHLSIQPAMSLKKTGIRLKKISGTLEHISFRRGCLYLPCIDLEDKTRALFHNLSLYESLCTDSCAFNQYMLLMLDLIHSKNDVKLLIDCGVIHNHLGNDMKALEMWSSLSKNFIITGSSADFHRMKAQIKKHCRTMKYVLWTEYRELFCSRPWYVISFLYATIVIIATCIQAYMSLFPKKQH